GGVPGRFSPGLWPRVPAALGHGGNRPGRRAPVGLVPDRGRGLRLHRGKPHLHGHQESPRNSGSPAADDAVPEGDHLMAEEPEVIREQIRETQESLASKLSTLEDKVVNTVTNTTESVSQTVENVKETVADTIETVKDSVESTVQTVKRTFDLEYQVDQR